MPGRAKKSLGQNYLINSSAALRIVDALRLEPGELVFEIGAGKGALTAHLADSGAITVSLEIDRNLCEELSGRFSAADNVEIVNADVLEIDFDREARRRGKPSCKIIGNIPYMLTSSILLKLPESDRALCSVIMVQKEVAERILEEPGSRNCGVLTIYLRSYLKAEKVMDVGAGSFYPRPAVDSTVCRFYPLKLENAPEDRELFLRFLKKAFSKRRKKLRNSLLDSGAQQKRRIQRELEKQTGVDMNRRAENLNLEEWFRIFESFNDTAGLNETC